MQMAIELSEGKLSYRPRETMRGSFSWSSLDQVKSLELRLFWYTRGKGTQDMTLVQIQRINSPAKMGRAQFEFRVPDGPYTMHGKLISVLWALELVSEGSKDVTRVDVVVSPWGEPVVLGEALHCS